MYACLMLYSDLGNRCHVREGFFWNYVTDRTFYPQKSEGAPGVAVIKTGLDQTVSAPTCEECKKQWKDSGLVEVLEQIEWESVEVV